MKLHREGEVMVLKLEYTVQQNAEHGLHSLYKFDDQPTNFYVSM
jgi:hypothetical protein